MDLLLALVGADNHEQKSHQQNHPAWYNVRWYQKGYPRQDNQTGCGEKWKKYVVKVSSFEEESCFDLWPLSSCNVLELFSKY